MEKRRYNWLPDLPDQRDFLFTLKAPAPPPLPKSIDLRQACPPVENQGRIGSCTGNAIAGALEFLELKELKNSVDDDLEPQIYRKGKFIDVSRLFIYYNERALLGTVDQDSGAMLRDGMKSLHNWGACREPLWEYSPTRVFKKPSIKAFEDGKAHKISTYMRLQSLAEMKQCLAGGYPFVFGFAVYESFESRVVAATGIMQMPKKTESLLGGHAVMACGYDDQLQTLWVRNSWGESWGMNGYFQMPYEYVENPRLAQDFWTIRK